MQTSTPTVRLSGATVRSGRTTASRAVVRSPLFIRGRTDGGRTVARRASAPRTDGRSISDMGGAHKPAQGVSTKPERSAIQDWFEAERQRLAGQSEGQPF
jgi:hypothetical protein